ncbi:DNA-processing protein DprA [Cellulomonas sp. PhB150]|uniref:DNA-processing protein DprA n=1 Tax=Cellulomonas sp. PhB150 TaxID=2485188 RepID=UPI000FB0FB0A|nr:DNA-processing protein DprA [Cellulomonas sp. PhB150]ROS28094.1 DNA protecting protein DprA [Cellulomonas sp. PhB150]
MSDDRVARAAWSALAEPGDLVAGALVATLGAVDALRLVVAAAEVGLAFAWADVVGEGAVDREQAAGGPGPGPVLGLGGVRLARAVERWSVRLEDVAPERDLGVLDAQGGSFVVPDDPGWPTGLDDLGAGAPFGLWVRGEPDLGVLLGRSVALVGSRASTTYGERVAVDLAAGAVDARACVVSGGAYGIDAAAHRGALSRGGRTVVLLAGGVDRAYPAGNARLFEAAVGQGGALVAEVPPGSVPTKGRFLQRNRVIAAGARATVVVEAAWRSGAMSTAHHAARLLRPVGAVPGPVTSVASAGCHRLLREGSAVCVTDAAEVMDLAGLVGADLVAEPAEPVGPSRRADGLDPGAVRVLDALPVRAGVTVDQVAARAGVTVGEARAALGLLELEARAARDGDRWRLAPA